MFVCVFGKRQDNTGANIDYFLFLCFVSGPVRPRVQNKFSNFDGSGHLDDHKKRHQRSVLEIHNTMYLNICI